MIISTWRRFFSTQKHAYARVDVVPKIFGESNKSIFSTYIFDGSNISSSKWQIYTTRFLTYIYLTLNHVCAIFKYITQYNTYSMTLLSRLAFHKKKAWKNSFNSAIKLCFVSISNKTIILVKFSEYPLILGWASSAKYQPILRTISQGNR